MSQLNIYLLFVTSLDNLKNHDFKDGEKIMILQGVRNLTQINNSKLYNKANAWIETMIINLKI